MPDQAYVLYCMFLLPDKRIANVAGVLLDCCSWYGDEELYEFLVKYVKEKS